MPCEAAGRRIEMLLISTPPGGEASLSFLYVHDGAVTLAGFETTLRRAMLIFEQIHAFELIYLANHSGLRKGRGYLPSYRSRPGQRIGTVHG